MIKIQVDGMTCGHCEKAVSQALASVPGVTKVVEVSREKGAALIEGTAEVAKLVAAVREEGYEAQAAQ
jgi:copper chaperone